jgi:lysophospholipase L1-like esterase
MLFMAKHTSIMLVLFALIVSTALGAEVQDIRYPVAHDNSEQPARMLRASEPNAPLLVGLHSWSANYKQDSKKYSGWCRDNGWNFIFPDFRGPNKTPQACGSGLVVADILAAVKFMVDTAKVDTSRIYLMGISGGGHASLLMAGRHPEIWAGVSAWVPIFDLNDWHRECTKKKLKYARMIELSTGGRPGASVAVNTQLRVRSPSWWLSQRSVTGLPLQINAGIHDGHTGSVPVSHTLNAFNVVAAPDDRIDDEEVAAMVKTRKVPVDLATTVDDNTFTKKVLLRRRSGSAVVNIFDGGHEGLYPAGLFWLAAQRKAPAKRKLLFIGDSITAASKPGYVKTLGGWYPELTIVNGGRSGRKTSDFKEIPPILDKHGDATHIYVLLGVNDLKDADDAAIEQCAVNTAMIVDMCTASTRAQVTVMAPVGLNLETMNDLNKRKKYNANTVRGLQTLRTRYAELARSKGVRFIDLYEAVPPDGFRDGLHPNEKGEKALAARIAEHVELLFPDQRRQLR